MKTWTVTILIILFLIPSLLSFCLPNTQAAGTITLTQDTIYSTRVTCSINYPELRFNQSANIFISISATFNNASISAVNITSVYLTLYYPEVNTTRIVSYPAPYYAPNYVSTFWLSSDYYESMPYLPRPEDSPPPYKVQRNVVNATTGTVNLDPYLLTPNATSTQQDRQAKLYVQIAFYLLDNNNQAIWRSDWSLPGRGYHWYVYTSEEIIPHVTIYSESSQTPPIGTDILIVIVVLIALLAGFLIIFNARRRRRNLTPPVENAQTLQSAHEPLVSDEEASE